MLSRDWATEPSDLASWTIQNEHGLIWPEVSFSLWPDKDWPPLTFIGEALIANMGPVTNTMRHAAGNITLAKLRLDEICEANTLDSFRLVRDRLPRKVVSLFQSQIAAVKDQARHITMIGLSAIKLATQEPGGMSIVDLHRMIQTSERVATLGPLETQDILHAAKGLLIPREYADGQHLEAYHSDFHLYATERYNEDLE